MSTHNFGALRTAVLDVSHARTWAQAVDEWEVVGAEEEVNGTGICVCGKTGLVYLYTIHNVRTGHTLFPIGSSCIRLFEVQDLDLTVGTLRKLIELRAAFVSGEDVLLTTDYFSRAVLADLCEKGAFPPNEFNRSNGVNDYKFLLDMFNQRHEPTAREKRKIWVLLNKAIRTFVLNDERLGQVP